MFRKSELQPKDSFVAAPAQLSSRVAVALMLALMLSHGFALAQTTGSSSVSGTVTDPSGAVVPSATVEMQNPVSQFIRTTTTDNEGKFVFANVPLNPYHLTVQQTG